jgi:flagella basal body P-ring formation protein FlgA
LTTAPTVGQASILNRAQISELVRQVAPELVPTNWCGATQVRITRRTRPLEEAETKDLLVAALQRDFVKDRGELELRFARAWAPVNVADEPFTVSILDMPAGGVSPNFIIRFELRAGSSLLGNWQIPVQAHIWRDVWVAGSSLQRGQPLKNADVVRERRDILLLKEALTSLDRDDFSLELAENLPAGTALTAHSLRLRPLVQRGRVVDAIVQDGAMTISVKAEVLEDGLPGQTIRLRNLKSKREFRGKVQNEETITVTL